MPHAASIAGLILAGGQGERLGGAIKSELVVGGVRLLDRVAERLSDCEPLLVAHGRHVPSALHLRDNHVPVADLSGDYGGPLAGLAGAVAYLATLADPPEFIVCAAVDTPFLPNDYVSRLADTIADGDVVIAGHGGQPYPTNAIWRVARFLDLPQRIVAGTAPHSLKSLGAEAGAAFLEWPEASGGDPFANINTPDELEKMERRATLSTGLSRE